MKTYIALYAEDVRHYSTVEIEAVDTVDAIAKARSYDLTDVPTNPDWHNAVCRRIVEVHNTANEVRILEANHIIAVHPVLDGRGQRRILAGHRSLPPPANSQTPRNGPPRGARSGDVVALRPLAFYDAVGKRLATNGATA